MNTLWRFIQARLMEAVDDPESGGGSPDQSDATPQDAGGDSNPPPAADDAGHDQSDGPKVPTSADSIRDFWTGVLSGEAKDGKDSPDKEPAETPVEEDSKAGGEPKEPVQIEKPKVKKQPRLTPKKTLSDLLADPVELSGDRPERPVDRRDGAMQIEPVLPAASPEPDKRRSLPDDLQGAGEVFDYAERKEPAKYSGLSGRLREYAEKRETKIEKLLSEDPDLSREDILASSDFKQWDRAQERAGLKPTIPAAEASRFKQDALRESITQDILEKNAKTEAELRRKLARLEDGPKIDAAAREAQGRIWSGMLSSDGDGVIKKIDAAIAEARKGGMSDVEVRAMLDKKYGPESSALISTLNDEREIIKAFNGFSRGIEEYEPDNKAHAAVIDRLDKYDKWARSDVRALEFIRESQGAPVGAKYLPRQSYFKLPKSGRSAYFTVGDSVVQQLLEAEAANNARSAAASARAKSDELWKAELERRGYSEDEIKTLSGKRDANASTANPAEPEARPQKPKPKAVSSVPIMPAGAKSPSGGTLDDLFSSRWDSLGASQK